MICGLAESHGMECPLKGSVLDNTAFLLLNANDVFAWATADCCQMDVDEGLDLLIEMQSKWGTEGYFAFLAEGRGMEPQEPWFEDHLDRDKYNEAREYVRGKNTGIFDSMAYDEHKLAAEIKFLKCKLQDANDEIDRLCGEEVYPRPRPDTYRREK
jgi:hypothetical protein